MFAFLSVLLYLLLIETNMADVGTLVSEENIKIIENIFKVEFENQEKNMVNLKSANVKSQLMKIQDEMKKIGKEAAGLKIAMNSQKTFWMRR